MSASIRLSTPSSTTKPSYPKRLPTPTLRKGGLTYEIRVRVPPEAKGGRFKGSHTTRSLGTRDKAEAYRRLPNAYSELQAEFLAEAKRHDEQLRAAQADNGPALAGAQVPLLSMEEACRLYRQRVLARRAGNPHHLPITRGKDVGPRQGPGRPFPVGDPPMPFALHRVKNAVGAAVVIDYGLGLRAPQGQLQAAP